MQIFLTIVSGVVVYVLGQMILHFVLEPIKEFNRQRGDASFLLLKFRAKIANASNDDPDLQSEIKEMGAALVSTMTQIPCFDFCNRLGIVPSKREVLKAAREIVGISYGIGPKGKDTFTPSQNMESAAEIARLLRIRTSYDDPT
jgi:hypothetical protein